MRCGRGCELFLNRKQDGRCEYLLSPFWDGHWTVRHLYQCISCDFLGGRYVPQTMHGSAICWPAHVQRVMNGLACVRYFPMCRTDLPHREGKTEGRKRVRTHCDSGWAGACAGKVQATGTGDWGFGGEGGRHGGGGTPGAGDWERRPAWAKTKDVDRQRVLLALWPSGHPGPQAFRASLLSVLSGPQRP